MSGPRELKSTATSTGLENPFLPRILPSFCLIITDGEIQKLHIVVAIRVLIGHRKPVDRMSNMEGHMRQDKVKRKRYDQDWCILNKIEP